MNALIVATANWLSVAIGILLDAGAKSVVLLGMALAVLLAMRRAPAAMRHLTGVVAMAGLLLLPVLSIMLPRWELLPSWTIAPAPSQHAWLEHAVVSQGAVAPESRRTSARRHAATGAHDTLAPVAVVPGTRPLDIGTAILFVWAVGVLLALLPTVAGLISLWNLARRCEVVAGQAWAELVQRTAGCLHLKRRVTLMKSARRRMPMTWGLLQARVLLPENADGWSVEQRRVVLLHEIAHVKRWDYLTNVVTQITCALYWFNPLVWLLARRIVTERECACDDVVLQQGTEPANYAEQLLQLASEGKPRLFAPRAAVAMARSTNLEGRLRAIVDDARNRARLSRAGVITTIVVSMVLVVPLAMARPAASAPEPTAAAGKALKFVRLVVEANRLILEGKPATPDQLEAMLEKIPNRKETVLELAVADENLPSKAYLNAQTLAARLVELLGFAYLSNVGLQPPESQDLAVREPQAAWQTRFELSWIVLPAAGTKRFLSLEDLQMYQEMPSNVPTVYLEQGSDEAWQLVIHNAHNYHPERTEGMQLWETRTAEEAAEPAGLAGIPFERDGFYSLRKDEMPITILIPQWGMLQADAFDERTHSVILQYKRVVKGQGSAPGPKHLPRRNPAGAEPKTGAYITRQGDTLAEIADLNRVGINALRKANPDVDWRRLKVGQKLIIPKEL